MQEIFDKRNKLQPARKSWNNLKSGTVTLLKSENNVASICEPLPIESETFNIIIQPTEINLQYALCTLANTNMFIFMFLMDSVKPLPGVSYFFSNLNSDTIKTFGIVNLMDAMFQSRCIYSNTDIHWVCRCDDLIILFC